MTTILYVPPPERADILADSVGGGKVPTAIPIEGGAWSVSNDHEWESPEAWLRAIKQRALVLTINGVPDSIGMGRGRVVLAAHECVPSPEGIPEWGENWAWNSHTWHLGSWNSATTIAYHAVPLRKGWGPHLQVHVTRLIAVAPRDFTTRPADRCRMRPAHALAHVLASRIGGSVVVLP